MRRFTTEDFAREHNRERHIAQAAIDDLVSQGKLAVEYPDPAGSPIYVNLSTGHSALKVFLVLVAVLTPIVFGFFAFMTVTMPDEAVASLRPTATMTMAEFSTTYPLPTLTPTATPDGLRVRETTRGCWAPDGGACFGVAAGTVVTPQAARYGEMVLVAVDGNGQFWLDENDLPFVGHVIDIAPTPTSTLAPQPVVVVRQAPPVTQPMPAVPTPMMAQPAMVSMPEPKPEDVKTSDFTAVDLGAPLETDTGRKAAPENIAPIEEALRWSNCAVSRYLDDQYMECLLVEEVP